MAKLATVVGCSRYAWRRADALAGSGRDARSPPAFPGQDGSLFPRMEAYFKELTLWLASGSEAAAALVIGLATIEATLRALWLFVKSALPWIGIREHQDEKERVRLRL